MTTANFNSNAAVDMVGNRYDLVLIAANRIRELKQGHKPKIVSNQPLSIIALEEIEQGLVGREYLRRRKY
jgi:DNA-directed RNA polymerase subunit omega